MLRRHLSLAAALCALWTGCSCSPAPPSFSDLFDGQTGSHRWHEGRSPLDDVYRPFEPDRVAGPPDPGWLEGQLYLAEERGAPWVGIAKAHFLLWRNQPGDLDRALGRLISVPRDATWWNERALIEMSAGNALAALDSADTALALEPGDPAALFNRAVALQRVGLRGGAREAWAAYLERDAGSGWAREAAARLEALQAIPVEKTSLEEERRLLTEELRNTRDAHELQALVSRPSAAALLGTLDGVGDRLLSEEIRVRGQFGREEWAASHLRAERIRREYEATLGGSPSLPALLELERAPEPTIAIQALRLRAYDALMRKPQEALALFDQVIERCAALGCPVESALALSDWGSIKLQAGDRRRAELAFRAAVDRTPAPFSNRRAEFLGKLANLAASSLEHRRAAELGSQAVAALEPSGDPGFLAGVLTNLGGQALALGLPSAALACYQEGRRMAEEVGRLSSEIYGFAGAGRALGELGRQDAAEAALEEAVALAREKEQVNPLISVLVGRSAHHLKNGRIAEARSDASEAAELASALDQPPRREWALARLAEAELAGGSLQAAKTALEEAIAISDASLRDETSPIKRTLRRAAGSDIRAQYARLLARGGEPAAAWEVIGGSRLRPLEADECMIAFMAIDESLLAWSATSAGTRFDEGPLDREATVVPVIAERRCPAGARRITVLENDVTVAAIGNRSARLADANVSVVIARRADSPWPTRSLEGPGLAVHSPRPVITDRLLPPLPGAPREAKVVMEAWQGSMELAGTHATPEEVAEVASHFDLLHFGVHAESRANAGASSYLVLAGEEGFLQVIDVLKLSLRERRPVVFLSACRGGGVSFEKEKDGAGLPWAFLEAGAEAVIAYQENLDDRAAVAFSEAFYPLVASGVGVAEAFERALATMRLSWSDEVVASFGLYI